MGAVGRRSKDGEGGDEVRWVIAHVRVSLVVAKLLQI